MPLRPPGRRNDPLHVGWMAAALVAAAIAGGAAGLLWDALVGDEEVPLEAAPEGS